MAYKDFYELDVWKRARHFKLAMYTVIGRFPSHEKFELTSQLRRAARSIPANLSEGHGRRTAKDELHFCTIARGSLSECLNHLIDAWDSNYISTEELNAHKADWNTLRQLLNGYMSYVQSKILPRSNEDYKSSNLQEPDVTYSELLTDENNLGDFLYHLLNKS